MTVAAARSAARSPGPSGDGLGGVRSGDVDALLDLAALTRAGWDPVTLVWKPDPSHPVLGFRCCGVDGCGYPADTAAGLCRGCDATRLALGGDDLAGFCRAGVQRRQWCAERLCLVCRTPGHERPATGSGLCIACSATARFRRQGIDAYVLGDDRFAPAVAHLSFGRCVVASCDRRAHNRQGLCAPHARNWSRAGRPDLERWSRTEGPVKGDRAGHVVLRGLGPRLIAEVLFGIQAAAAEGRKTPPVSIRGVVEWLRRTQEASVLTVDPAATGSEAARMFLAFTADRLAVALSSPEREYPKDVWDLRPWGHPGRLSFVGGGGPARRNRRRARPVTQRWLREAAKRWAFDSLAATSPGPAQQMLWVVGLWSEHLATRADHGERAAELTRADMMAFLARLGSMERAGQLSASSRSRAVEDLARFLRDCRELGLTGTGGPMAGLADDVAIRRSERPRRPKPGGDNDTGSALPAGIVAALLDEDSLGQLQHGFGPGARRLVELLAGVGRRPDEVCSLPWACLDHDETIGADGQPRRHPVLVHDMPKVGRLGCRLPIHERERALILAQQAQVQACFPDTPTGELALFPRAQKNPDGRAPVRPNWLSRTVRAWVDALASLDLPELDPAGRPVAFDRSRVFPYAFRHTFAQRHADNGVHPDVLKELMGHETITTTMGYYRVTAKRKREAQDRLGPLQVDAGGQAVRPGRASLSASEAARDDVGQVAVPFGVCTEPANVRADGRSCPFRHRCLGCTYFRTDASFQPQLRSYLTNLLADRERLSAAAPQLAGWAQRDALPSEGEIEALRRLIAGNDAMVAALDDADREAVADAIATVRRHRAGLETTFPVQFRGLVRQSVPDVFPNVEAQPRSAERA